MKNYIIGAMLGLSLLGMQSCVVSEKPSVDFFNTAYYRNQADFVSFNVPTFLAKSFIKNQLKGDGDNQEIIDLVKKVSKINLMASENMDPKVMQEFDNYLTKENFEEWASIRNEGDVINIKAQKSEDVIKKLMIVVNSKGKDAVFIDVSGQFTNDDIAKLIDAGRNSKIKVNRKKS